MGQPALRAAGQYHNDSKKKSPSTLKGTVKTKDAVHMTRQRASDFVESMMTRSMKTLARAWVLNGPKVFRTDITRVVAQVFAESGILDNPFGATRGEMSRATGPGVLANTPNVETLQKLRTMSFPQSSCTPCLPFLLFTSRSCWRCLRLVGRASAARLRLLGGGKSRHPARGCSSMSSFSEG